MAKRRQGRAKRWAVGLVIAIVFYTVIGFLILPAIIKSQMLQRLPALTHRRVAIQEVKLNPYALSFTLRGLSLTETNGDEFISLGELYVNFESISLLKRGFVFKEISVKKPSANIVRLLDGAFNFANLLTNAPPSGASPKASQQLPLVMIDELKVEDGRISFTDLDRKKPFRREWGPINVALTKFTTRPKEGSPYSVVVSTEDGRTFAWSGEVTLTPLHSAGTFKLTGFQITRYAPYIEDAAPIKILSGQVDLRTDYRFDVTGEEAIVAVSNVTLDVTNLVVETAQPKPARAIVDQLHLSVSGVRLDTAAKTIDVAEVRLVNLKTGVILLPGAATTSSVAEAVAPVPPQPNSVATQTNKFQIRIGEVALDNVSFHFTDESVEPHVESTVGEFTGSVKGLTSDLDTVAAVDFKGKVNNYAPFSISGKINPLASDLFVDLAISLKDDTLLPGSAFTQPNTWGIRWRRARYHWICTIMSPGVS